MTVYRQVAEVGSDDKLLEIRPDRDNLRNNPVRGEYMNDRVGNAGFCDRGITAEPAHVGNPPKEAPIWRIIFCLSITAAAATFQRWTLLSDLSRGEKCRDGNVKQTDIY